MAAAQLKAFLTRITGSSAQLAVADLNRARDGSVGTSVLEPDDILNPRDSTVTSAPSSTLADDTSQYADVSLVETAYHKERHRIRMFVAACVRAM